jgi:hypothetical protein
MCWKLQFRDYEHEEANGRAFVAEARTLVALATIAYYEANASCTMREHLALVAAHSYAASHERYVWGSIPGMGWHPDGDDLDPLLTYISSVLRRGFTDASPLLSEDQMLKHVANKAEIRVVDADHPPKDDQRAGVAFHLSRHVPSTISKGQLEDLLWYGASTYHADRFRKGVLADLLRLKRARDTGDYDPEAGNEEHDANDDLHYRILLGLFGESCLLVSEPAGVDEMGKQLFSWRWVKLAAGDVFVFVELAGCDLKHVAVSRGRAAFAIIDTVVCDRQTTPKAVAIRTSDVESPTPISSPDFWRPATTDDTTARCRRGFKALHAAVKSAKAANPEQLQTDVTAARVVMDAHPKAQDPVGRAQALAALAVPQAAKSLAGFEDGGALASHVITPPQSQSQ